MLGRPSIFLATFLVAIVASGCGPTRIDERQASALKSVPPTPPKQIVLSDTQRLAKAKLMFGTWRGDLETYQSGMTLLFEIGSSSNESKAARELEARWTDRKSKADERREAEEKARLAQEKATSEKASREAEAEELRQQKKEMASFTGSGVKIAVGNVELHSRTELHTANKGFTFISLFIGALNDSDETVHVNPNDFTLADSDGNTSSHEQDTYSLSNYFDAVNLRPGQKTSGWLVFLLRKDKKYTLSRVGIGQDAVEKTVIP